MNYSPDELRELIPLYLNKRLSEKEKKEFEYTLDKYPELKHELEEFSRIKDVYKEIELGIPTPSSILYQRILKNIKPEAKLSLTPPLKGYLERLQNFLKGLVSSTRLSWGVAVLQFAVILILVITLVRGDRFRTLTSTGTPPKDVVRVNIIFDKDSREREIRDVLNKVGAMIIRGPSPEGLYIIEIKGKKDVEEMLGVLIKTGIVRFAERAY